MRNKRAVPPTGRRPARFRLRRAVLPLLSLSLLAGCAAGPRPFFHRDLGAWALDGPALPPSPVPGEPSALKRIAEGYLGVPYLYAGQTRNGMDCSGFVRQVFKEWLGLDLPRNSKEQATVGEAVPRDALQPGDLVFFRSLLSIDHAGIYMGDGRFIHASTSIGVSYAGLDEPYFRHRYAGARRLAAAVAAR